MAVQTKKYIEGIDVSRHQKGLNWGAVVEAGHRFAIVKATEGVDYLDPLFYEHVERAREAGLVVGAYHFARPSSRKGPVSVETASEDARAEAECFVHAIRCADVELQPWLDFEEYSDNGPRENAVWIRTFVSVIEDSLDVSPGIYTGRNIWRYELGNTGEFDHLPLWLAAYSKRKRVPDARGRVPDLWQWSGGGSFAYGPKIDGRVVDLNRYTGSDFEDFCKPRMRRPWSTVEEGFGGSRPSDYVEVEK